MPTSSVSLTKVSPELLALLSCFCVAACSSGGGNNGGTPGDAGTQVDATTPADGSAPPDAGGQLDGAAHPDTGTPPDASPPADSGLGFTLGLSDASVVSTYAQRAALGFKFGYVDGVLGAVNDGGAYTFFVSGHTVAADAGTCTGANATPNTQGAYRVGVAPDSITQNFGCQALIANAADVVPDGGASGPFDRDYVGGGPVLELKNGTSDALALFYHAEFHWGPTCGGAPCFYGTLGLAVSVDGGATFTKLGEIVQPAVARPDWITNHASSSLSIGAGPFVLGDATGAPVDPATASPATTYVYVFFDDYDTTNATPCDKQQCVAVARAPLQDVVNAAFGLPGAKASTALFSKYHTGDTGGPFVQPAASGSTDDTTAGGHYTALLSGAFELSALYDQPIGKFLLAYKSTATGGIQLRTTSNLTSWPDGEVAGVGLDEDGGVRYPSLMGEQPSAEVGAKQPYLFYTNGLNDWKTSTFMSRRVVVTTTP